MSFIVRTFPILNTSLCGLSARSNNLLVNVFQVRNYAARKGTREKARKKKVKVEEKKIGFIPHNQRGLDRLLQNRPKKKFDDSWKQVATDNVYPAKYYQWKVYSFAEAVQCHRETHHPTMYNEPDAPLKVLIELNMEGEKKTRFVDNFYRVAPIPHAFDHGEERNILAFTKDVDMQKEARVLGATLAGGIELIKDIQTGALSMADYHYILAHPNILPELVSLRGLMKRKFPNPKNGTLGPDMSVMVHKFLHGITYSGIKDEHEQDFGTIDTTIGILSMDPKHLEENFASLIKDVNSARPKRSGTFITRCLLLSPPSSEKLKVDHNLYLEEKKQTDTDEDDDVQEMRATA